MNIKEESYTFLQKVMIIISLGIMLVALCNRVFQWHLFGWEFATFSTISIFISSILLWIFVALDWPSVLCILSLGLMPEIGMTEIGKLSFGNTTFIFLFCTFIVTYALNQTPFLRRVTAKVLNNQWSQEKPWRFILLLLFVFLILGSFFSPSVLFMFAFPLFEEVCRAFHLEKGNKSAASLLFGIYTVIAIGTAMTPINHVFAITAMGTYEAAIGKVIGNWEYMSFAVPTGLVIFAILILVLKYIFPIDVHAIEAKQISSLHDLPEVTKKEKIIVSCYGVMILMWLLPEMLSGFFPTFAGFFKNVGIAFPPMITMIVLAILRVDGKKLLDIPEAIQKGVHWPSLLLVASTLSLGSVIANPEIGVVKLIQTNITSSLTAMSPMLLIFIFLAWAGIQTNFSSNLVTTSMVTTVAVSVLSSDNMGVNLAVICCLIGFLASIAMMTPPAMPYVSISIGSGWIKSQEAFKMGLIVLIISIITALFIGYNLGVQIL